MNGSRRNLGQIALAAIAFAALSQAASAQPVYPNKPVKLVVPYAPGGSADALARLLGQRLTEGWSQQVVIDNKPGANGIVGTEFAAKQPPDGYSLYMGTDSQVAINPSIYASLPYDWNRDFVPITLLATMTQVLIVPSSLQVNTVGELIALAKSKPGQINYSSIGLGSSPHLAAELFKSQAGVDLVHVPYKSAGQSTTALLTGEAQVLFTSESTASPHVKSGRVRALATVGKKRTGASPDLPTLAESGLPDYEFGTWYALLAPTGTPDAVLKKLNSDVARVIDSKEMRAALLVVGLEPLSSTPEWLRSHAQRDLERQSALIKRIGIKPQ